MVDWVAAGRDVVVPNAAEKRLDDMDRLGDMLHFPPLVNLGASVNVLVTIAATWWVAVRFLGPMMPLLWIALVLAVNLLPVIALRLTMNASTAIPTLRSMDFVRDQHKFSNWVYLAASANMAFWVLLAWSLSLLRHEAWVLGLLLVGSFCATFSPVLLRGRSQ